MSKKSSEVKHRQQVEKALRNINKPGAKSSGSATSADPSLRDQYDIIKKDLLKLREDLARGYDMAKNLVEKKGLVKEILNTK